ncbi:dienelactone hydrolase family protein [Pandoraea oxalativorans]|uniref:Carboxymethylenebutenolidase n=1 Tax=Pandoraea oxalativorans TaxID=573737 RepID=A0A0E3U5N7_9BURK|nr:dienelactone hydrolase family protein [Pandoraea oxalativorans]AKC68758.1 carboxymethylenebutenolidase [Pandoraea oxalativorans]
MAGRFISIKSRDGKTFQAYLATPDNKGASAGKGPGLVLCQEIFGVNAYIRELADRYAEEGYVVLAPDLFWRIEPGIELGYTPGDWQRAFALFQSFDVDLGMEDVGATVDTLRSLPECVGGVGVLGYCLGGKLAALSVTRTSADVAIGYYGVGLEQHVEELAGEHPPLVLHIAELDKYAPAEVRDTLTECLGKHPDVTLYSYPDADHAFARPGDHFNRAATQLAHQRTLAAIRNVIGPHFDFASLWETHCAYEFAIREIDPLMKTMVSEPYVNHIPTMTGGVGHQQLAHFYRNHFVNSNPPDTKLIPISRTIGATQLVDELLFCFTHTTPVDWMLPGVAPTGRRVEIPLVAIVRFRGDKLEHEHIYWDQASVLVQIGLLDPKGLPVAGVETARKLQDENLASNALMPNWSFGTRAG